MPSTNKRAIIGSSRRNLGFDCIDGWDDHIKGATNFKVERSIAIATFTAIAIFTESRLSLTCHQRHKYVNPKKAIVCVWLLFWQKKHCKTLTVA
jgi:hypothetical protein